MNVDAASSRVALAKPADRTVATRLEAASTLKKQPWPKSLPDQVRVLQTALAASPLPGAAEELARSFSRARTDRVADLLETLADLGQAQRVDEKFVKGS